MAASSSRPPLPHDYLLTRHPDLRRLLPDFLESLGYSLLECLLVAELRDGKPFPAGLAIGAGP